MQNFTLNFGGFYYSFHSDIIDGEIESYFSNDQGELKQDLDDLDINYSLVHSEYSKQYVKYLEEYLQDEYKLDIKLHFKGLYSPRYYNFGTDTIDISISEKNVKKIISTFINDDLIEYINDTSKSCPGFISFYEGYEEVKKDTSILLQYVFNFILESFNGYNNKDLYEGFYGYYDQNSGYELLYYLDFYKKGNDEKI